MRKGDGSVVAGFDEIDWRQGHFLAVDDFARLFPEEAAKDNVVAMVISHDCDLARDPDAEPSVEVLIGKTIQSLNGNYTHAKNARTLHLAASQASNSIFVEFFAASKLSFDKNELLKIVPKHDTKLTFEELNTLQVWLAARYRRSAFPNEFNRRLEGDKVADKIAKKLAPLGETLTGLYFDLEQNEELEKAENAYQLGIYVLWKDDGDEDKFSKIENLVLNITAIFEKAFYKKESDQWNKIELTECIDVSENAMSYELVSRLQKWNADYISLRASPQHELPK